MITNESKSTCYVNFSFQGEPKENGNIPALPTSEDAQNVPDVFTSVLETKEERTSRRRSHYIVFLTIFVLAIGFSIVITGVFPYLKLLEDDPQLSKTKLGWVIAANPFGQMIVSPILGFMGNKLGSIRTISYFTVILYCIGTVLYGVLPRFVGLWAHSAYHLMILSRLITGMSSANLTLCRSYLAASTTIKERTNVMASLSAAVSLGYIVGPVLQLSLNLLIKDEQTQYQASGYIPAALGLFNFILLTPWIFKEYDIAKKERLLLRKLYPNMKKILPKADKVGLISIMFCVFILQYNYIALETLMEPFVQDQYGWCDELSVIIVGAILTVTGIIFLSLFIISAKLAEQYDERCILICLGFAIAIIGIIIFQPWGPRELNYCDSNTSTVSPTETIPMSITSNSFLIIDHKLNKQVLAGGINYTDGKSDLYNKFCGDITSCLGCPSHQEWCKQYPQLPLPQFLLSVAILMSSFPFGMSMTNTLASKMIGPKPQGTWMGFLTSSGSLARMLAPIFVFYIYTTFGTRYVSYMLLFGTLLALVTLKVQYRRLIPMKVQGTSNAETERF